MTDCERTLKTLGTWQVSSRCRTQIEMECVSPQCALQSLLEASNQNVSRFHTSRIIAHCRYQTRTSSLNDSHKLLARTLNPVPQIDPPPRLLPKHHACLSRRICDHRMQPTRKLSSVSKYLTQPRTWGLTSNTFPEHRSSTPPSGPPSCHSASHGAQSRG